MTKIKAKDVNDVVIEETEEEVEKTISTNPTYEKKSYFQRDHRPGSRNYAKSYGRPRYLNLKLNAIILIHLDSTPQNVNMVQ